MTTPICELDIHRTKTKVVQFYDRMANDQRISDSNRQTIVKFYNHCKAAGLKDGRLMKILWVMQNIGSLVDKDFAKCDKQDIEALVTKLLDIKKHKSGHETERLAKSTIVDHQIILKKFYKWLKGKGEKMPKEVSWIKPKTCDCMKTNGDMLTDKEVLSLIAATTDIRAKAMISLLYETGARASEFLSLRLKDIEIGDIEWAITITNSKTTQRTVYVFDSIPYLSDWLNIHKHRNDPNAFLWSKNGHPYEPIGYNMLVKIIKNLGKRTGIKKPFNLHNFRHSSITKNSDFLTDQQLKLKYGWTRSSRQLSTYVHLNNKSLRDAERKARGLNQNNENTNLMEMRECHRCGNKNLPDKKVCTKCYFPLDAETAKQTMDIIDFVLRANSALNEMKGLDDKTIRQKMRKLIMQDEYQQEELKENNPT